MPTNKKKSIRKIRAKTGMTYQAAKRVHDNLTSARSRHHQSDSETRLRRLLRELGVTALHPIVVGRSHEHIVAGFPVRPPVVSDQQTEYFAATGPKSIAISRAEHDALLRAGAADGRDLVIVRSTRASSRQSRSIECPSCGWWIYCGAEPRESVCRCGQRYRVAFDAVERDVVALPEGRVCGFCEATSAEAHGDWHELNTWQRLCPNCWRGRTRRAVREFVADCDYETSERAGAGGMFQVSVLEEHGRDVTRLVDQGVHFHGVEDLSTYLEAVTGASVSVEAR